MASINPSLRRSYDLRGVVGSALSGGDAYGVGRAFAAIVDGSGGRTVAVSRDGRVSSPDLEAQLVNGLVEGGIHVMRLPLGPTPLVSFAANRLSLDAAIMVTGSHNPADQNGFKLRLGSNPFSGHALERLWTVDPVRREGGTVEEIDVSDDYLDALLAETEGLELVSAVWDSGNGATGPLVDRIVTRLGAGHQAVFTQVDGRFPNHHPDPTIPENMELLARAVETDSAELGIAFDGDGDRIGLIDRSGEMVWADQHMLLLAGDVLSERPGASIVADVKCSQALFDGVAALGGRPLMSPSGYVRVREVMLEHDAPLAGEMSGHIFYGDRWHHADDALYVAMRTLRALARSGQTLRQFRDRLAAVHATPELRLRCPDARKAEVLAALLDMAERSGAMIDRTDGLRVMERNGWWLARASGTEAKITIRCEAEDPNALDGIKRRVAQQLDNLGIETTGLI